MWECCRAIRPRRARKPQHGRSRDGCAEPHQSSAQAPSSVAATTQPSTAAAGPRTFTDDRGTKIERPRRPARIVAQVGPAAALWDFGIQPIAIFGPHKLKDGGKDSQAGNVDITKVTGLGNVWDEFNVEQYIALQPELLVSSMYLKGMLQYVPDKSKDTIEQVAPSAGIMLTGQSATQVKGRRPPEEGR